MPVTPENLTEALLAAAHKAGADAADTVAVERRSQSIGVRAGTLEQAERSERVEVGLRVFVGQRQACVGASDTREETLVMLAERAVAMAREAPQIRSPGWRSRTSWRRAGMSRRWNCTTPVQNRQRPTCRRPRWRWRLLRWPWMA